MSDAQTADSRFHSVPVIGWIARDIAQEPESFWYALVILVTIMVLMVKTWGIMVLSLTAMALVPVIFVLLLMITRG